MMRDNLRSNDSFHQHEHQATLADVVITDALTLRTSRPPDHLSENQALRLLARAIADDPRKPTRHLTRIAKGLCRADSAEVCPPRSGLPRPSRLSLAPPAEPSFVGQYRPGATLRSTTSEYPLSSVFAGTLSSKALRSSTPHPTDTLPFSKYWIRRSASSREAAGGRGAAGDANRGALVGASGNEAGGGVGNASGKEPR